MKIKNNILALSSLALLCSCQKEAPQVDSVPKRVYTVRALLPDADKTRSHITYGNTDSIQENFRWYPIDTVNYNANDYISVANFSNLSEYDYCVELNAVEVNGNSAVFESEVEQAGSFPIKKGDVIFASYWATDVVQSVDSSDADKNIFKIVLQSDNPETSDNKPQLIVDNPYDDMYMTYMKSSLKMYDIVTAVEDDKIPDLHFKHLSAILRVTLRNETGGELWPKSLEFESPGNTPFFGSNIFCSVDKTPFDGYQLKIHEQETDTYTDKVVANINNYTAALDADKGGPIAQGRTYDLYVIAYPRMDNEIVSKNLIITLQDRDSSSASDYYTMTLNGFNRPIEAGKRYWFKLTACIDEETRERKLMLNSQWDKLQEEKNKENGEKTPSGD